jgi:hypothetical protein
MTNYQSHWGVQGGLRHHKYQGRFKEPQVPVDLKENCECNFCQLFRIKVEKLNFTATYAKLFIAASTIKCISTPLSSSLK